ncbi:2671_t:CDS:1, partial [Funneliformis caledonium]
MSLEFNSQNSVNRNDQCPSVYSINCKETRIEIYECKDEFE